MDLLLLVFNASAPVCDCIPAARLTGEVGSDHHDGNAYF
jgi:hypothetical protein